MQQAVPAADSVRRALEDVFARPEYVWEPRFSLGDWIREQALRLFDWIGRQQTAHPAAFKVVLGILIAVLAGLLLHMGYVVWRITRPTARTPAGPAPVGGLRPEDARAHRRRADELARAGRYAEALGHRFARRSRGPFVPPRIRRRALRRLHLPGIRGRSRRGVLPCRAGLSSGSRSRSPWR